MQYRLSEIEITRPLAPLKFGADENGAALLIRRNGRPIGFLMRENSGKRSWTAEELDHWIGDALKAKIVEEAIRDELAQARTDVSFPSLSVAICTRDRVATLERCLDSLLPLQQKYGFELLVIDNAPSDDTTARLVKKFSTARYVLEQRPGLDFARNRAWMESTGELIAYLDDDVIVDSGWVAGLQEAWGENSDAAAFTGLVMPLRLDTTAQVLFEKRMVSGVASIRIDSAGRCLAIRFTLAAPASSARVVTWRSAATCCATSADSMKPLIPELLFRVVAILTFFIGSSVLGTRWSMSPGTWSSMNTALPNRVSGASTTLGVWDSWPL